MYVRATAVGPVLQYCSVYIEPCIIVRAMDVSNVDAARTRSTIDCMLQCSLAIERGSNMSRLWSKLALLLAACLLCGGELAMHVYTPRTCMHILFFIWLFQIVCACVKDF